MPNYIIGDQQLQIISQNILTTKDLDKSKQLWESFNEDQRKVVIELLGEDNSSVQKINEGNWMNTLGDIVGIFDPTGVVDLVNGISYISQGDNLFGFLSIVSAVPYIGDLVAKPVMGALKVGAPAAKSLKGILDATRAAKTPAEMGQLAEKLKVMSDSGGLTGKFVKGIGSMSDKLKSIITRLPGGPTSGIKNTILQWIDLFERAGKTGKVARTGVGNVAKQYELLAKSGKAITDLEKSRVIALLSQEIKSIKNIKGGAFTGYRTPNKIFSSKNIYGGVPQIIGRNKSVRALMRKTKWWAGFLDWLGLGNFVGPEEVITKLGSENEMVRQMEKYNQTEKAQKYYQEEFGDIPVQSQQQSPTPQDPQQSKKEDGFIQDLIKGVFLGPLKPLSN